MSVRLPSFAKLNLGLRIGPARSDGFHELRTIYQTIGLHDYIRVSVERGTGIEIRCEDARVPTDANNTCFKIAERVVEALKVRGRVTIEIEKRLPVQGGLGGASGNAVTTMLALERALRKKLAQEERLRIAAEVGSDLPLFLVGGTVLGVGRGEEVYPVPELPETACVIALPEVAVSTPKAFADWDRWAEHKVPRLAGHSQANDAASLGMTGEKDAGHVKTRNVERRGQLGSEGTARESRRYTELTSPEGSDRMLEFSRELSAWLSSRSGVSARGGGRAENPLLDLVRTGIENDFERVVFPQHPELREVKSVLERAGASYASLSGSGSAVYGLFESRPKAERAVKRLKASGTEAVVTTTLTRRKYWKKLGAMSV
jgi:4-diphosphocytidyl-2-C-methyl-D-erythritol kinase